MILAAGESSRCWPINQGHKSQVKIMGKPLVYWTIKGLAKKGIKDIIIIAKPDSKLNGELGPLSAELGVRLSFVVQEKPLGTGDAISRASDLIQEPFFVFWPYKIQSEDMVEKILAKRQEGYEAVLIGTKTATPWDYGILKLEGERVVEIVEKPKSGQEPSSMKVVGTYFLSSDFFEYYQKVKHHPTDFVDALNLYIKEKKTGFVALEKEPPPLKYCWEFLAIFKTLLESKEFSQSIAPTASLGKNVVIDGNVHIGENVNIGAGTVISGPCFIGDNCKIGANNVLRGPVNLEKDIVTGAFTEIKNCLIQKGTHFHSGYFGDSVIGENCRFGAGFITANRRIDRGSIKSLVKGKKIDTSLTYFGMVVGHNSCFGIKSGTMPGVLVGSNCLIGPGTLVFENIEDETTLYTQFKNIVKKRE